MKEPILFKRGRFWWICYYQDGFRVRKSTGFTSRRSAELYRNDLAVKLARNEIFGVPLARKFSQAAREYLDHIELHRTQTTLAAHRHGVTSFVRYLQAQAPPHDDIDLSKIDTPLVRNYQASLIHRGLKANSINLRMMTLSGVLNWAKSSGYIAETPTSAVPAIRVPERRVRFLDGPQFKRVLVACPLPHRDIVYALAATGMRVSELQSIEWPQVDFRRGCLHLINKPGYTTKDKKARDIPMTEPLMKFLRDRRKANGYLFPQLHSRKYRIATLLHAFQDAVKRCGLPKMTLHDLRHTFASALIQAGVSLYHVKELLGHASIKTTEIYAHLSPKSLGDVVRKNLPW